MDALIYPFIDNPTILGDVLNRLAWALTPRLPEDFNLFVPAEFDFRSPGFWSDFAVPDYELDALRDSPLIQHCRRVEPNRLKHPLKTVDCVLVWEAGSLQQAQIQPLLDRVLVVDPHFYLDVEAANYARLRYLVSSQSKQEAWREASRRLFTEWFARYSGIETACLFLTGPSLEAGLSHPLPDNSLRIICNSLVKNKPLLEKIQPDLLVFADPAFHYGISKYAAAFREQALETLAAHPDCICIVPENYLPLLLGHFSIELTGRLIGMPVAMGQDFNFPDPARFWVRATENILTHLMLPIASAVAQEIHIFGADGRQKKDAGFWQHNPAAQFSGLIATVYQAHPSLERDRDIEAYYAVHCKTVEQLIQQGERQAGRRYIAETPSFIPALHNRIRRPR
jgi:hypothetical protein